jgi:long-chain fatty acid transport protein
MSTFNNRTILGLAVALTLAAGTASATNGYFTHGIGTKSKSMAGSGSADPQELLEMATNPAGLALLPESIDAGLGIFSPRRHYKTSPSQLNGNCFTPPGSTQPFCPFTIGPNNITSENEYFFVPYVAMNWKLDEQSALGAAFYARGGMNTEWQGGTASFDPDGAMGPAPAMTFKGTYGGGFTGGDGTAGVDLMQAFMNLTYAWKTADDQFALGASAILAIQSFQARGVAAFSPYTKTYIESYMTTGQPKMPTHLSGNGHDLSYGYGGSIGALWNATKWLSLSAAYTSKMSMSNFSDYSDLFAENGSFDIPSSATYGLTLRPSDAFTFNFDYQSIWYSDVASVSNPIENLFGCPAVGGTNLEGCLGGKQGAGFGWRDMSVYKFGGSWKYSDQWTFRAGYSFPDSQPIPRTQMEFNILAPGVVEEHWTLGFTNKLASGNEWSLSFMYAPEFSVKGQNNFDPTQTVEFGMDQYELEVSYSWKR